MTVGQLDDLIAGLIGAYLCALSFAGAWSALLGSDPATAARELGDVVEFIFGIAGLPLVFSFLGFFNWSGAGFWGYELIILLAVPYFRGAVGARLAPVTGPERDRALTVNAVPRYIGVKLGVGLVEILVFSVLILGYYLLIPFVFAALLAPGAIDYRARLGLTVTGPPRYALETWAVLGSALLPMLFV